MPLCAIAAAGYAAYVANEKMKAPKNDANLKLEGMASIPLMQIEQGMSIMEKPVTTLSFLSGDYKEVVPSLEKRVALIINKNPWLGGLLAWDEEKIKIYFDESGECPLTNGHFQAFEPFVIPLHAKTEYADYAKLLNAMGALIPENFDLVGKSLPFWKVAVVPDSETPDERFALVVSMSHAVGDAFTYYKLFNMLDMNATVIPLDAFRLPEYHIALAAKVGSREANYLRYAIQKPAIDLSGKEPHTMKMFYVNQDWVIDKKGDYESVFCTDVSASGSVAATDVSKNSTLTSWFFKLNEASIGLMTLNLRNRLDDSPVGDANAGNYVYPIIYTPVDYETPGLIQQSISSFRRCGPDTPEELPAFRWDMTSSISVNWCNYYPDEMCLHDGVTTEIHLPLWEVATKNMFPNRVSCLQLFTACPTGIDGGERRVGAFVMCQESAWEKIKTSGIVDEMISDIC